jgi:uncharacterized protein YheU (UPF0270 family)
MLIPHEQLTAEALRGIAEQYVLTHMSEADDALSFELWVDKVLRDVREGRLVVEYSELHETVFLKPRDTLDGCL